MSNTSTISNQMPTDSPAAVPRSRSLERLDAARAAMAQRKDVQPEWVITTFGTLVDGLKAATTSPDTSPIPPRSASSDPGPQVNIGILQRLGFVQTGKMLGDQLGCTVGPLIRELLLNRIKQRAVHNRRLLAGQDLALVFDL